MNAPRPFSARRAARMERFRKITLYPVLSPEFTNGRGLPEVLEMVADGGAKIVQLRMKNAGGLELFRMAEKFREATLRHDMLLIIDDDASVAAAVDADGVHLGRDDLPLSAAGRLFPDLIIGASTHNPEEVVQAQEENCDYLNVGPLFATATKRLPTSPVGLEMLARVRPLIRTPFTVMGGIKCRHLPELVKSGVRRVAMVTEITQAANVAEAVRQMVDELAAAGAEERRKEEGL